MLHQHLSASRRDSEMVATSTGTSTGASTSDITAVAKLPITPDEPSEIDALVVDDDATLQRLIQRFLSKGCFANIFVASSGAEALELYRQHPGIHFVTMDYNMPGMTGSETIAELKKLARACDRELRVVGVTSEESPTIKNSMTDAGAERIFAKPAEYAAFKAFVNENFSPPAMVRHYSIP